MKGGIGNLMKQAQQLQANMQKAQAEIAAMEVTGESGGGMVKVTINGRHEAKRVQIDPSVPMDDRKWSRTSSRRPSTTRCTASKRPRRRRWPA